jgi:hypothetical protein
MPIPGSPPSSSSTRRAWRTVSRHYVQYLQVLDRGVPVQRQIAVLGPSSFSATASARSKSRRFMLFAPLEGWRHVKVTDRHTGEVPQTILAADPAYAAPARSQPAEQFALDNRRQTGILVDVHPVLLGIAEASQLQFPRPGPDRQPIESSESRRRPGAALPVAAMVRPCWREREATQCRTETPPKISRSGSREPKPGTFHRPAHGFGIKRVPEAAKLRLNGPARRANRSSAKGFGHCPLSAWILNQRR